MVTPAGLALLAASMYTRATAVFLRPILWIISIGSLEFVQVECFGLLRLLLMCFCLVDVEVLQQLTTKAVLGEHATNAHLHDAVRILLQQFGRCGAALSAGISSVADVLLVGPLLSAQLHFGRVDHHETPILNLSPQQNNVDQVYELEKKIIEILILYGDKKVVFDEIKISKSEEGDVVYKNVKIESQVFEKVFLDLQSDEIEFANPEFKELYRLIIKNFQSSNFDISSILNSIDGELSNLVTTIMMKDDIYQLHKWKSKNVYVKDKNKSISQLVTETILTLRTLLINRKVNELSKTNSDSENLDQNLLEEIVNYYQLKNFLSKKLNRVI